MSLDFDQKDPDTWESKKDKYKVKRSFRAYTVEERDGRKYRPYVSDKDRNVEVYHCYDGDEYIGQSEDIDGAFACADKKEKEKKDKKEKREKQRK